MGIKAWNIVSQEIKNIYLYKTSMRIKSAEELSYRYLYYTWKVKTLTLDVYMNQIYSL